MKVVLRICLILGLAAAAVSQTACATYQRVALSEDIRLANRRFEQKQYLVARAMYRRLIDKYPDCPARQEMMVKIGQCFFNDQFHSLHDARMAYLEYLENYPTGFYADDARENLRRIDALMNVREQTVDGRMDRVAENIKKIQDAIAKDPENAQLYNSADLYVRLGDALWKLDRYDEAKDAYVKARELNPELAQHPNIVKRVGTGPDGKPIALTPEAQKEIERDQNPLVVFDDHSYNSRSSKDVFTAREVYYNVQGLVRNQSSKLLKGVVVEVRFLDAARNQLDSQRETVGDMPPGSVRAFGVRASRFDNIYNVAAYECHAYERYSFR